MRLVKPLIKQIFGQCNAREKYQSNCHSSGLTWRTWCVSFDIIIHDIIRSFCPHCQVLHSIASALYKSPSREVTLLVYYSQEQAWRLPAEHIHTTTIIWGWTLLEYTRIPRQTHRISLESFLIGHVDIHMDPVRTQFSLLTWEKQGLLQSHFW